MRPPETQFEADGQAALIDLIRAHLGAESRPPSRRRVAGWLAEGAVRADGVVVTDGRLVPPAGATVDLIPAEVAPRHGSSPVVGTGHGGSGLEVLHVDRHVLVAEAGPALAPAHLEAAARVQLQRLGLKGFEPHLVPPSVTPTTGVVLAALSPDARAAMEESFAGGKASLRVVLELAARPGGLPVEAVLREGRDGRVFCVGVLDGRGVAPFLDVLEASGIEPLRRSGPPTVHVEQAAFPHPTTCRPLTFVSRAVSPIAPQDPALTDS